MPKSSRIKLVVDASIANSAGKLEHPVSKACRDLLECIFHNAYLVVMTDDISTEWKNHSSRFAIQWLSSMWARKRVLNLSIDQNKEIRIKLTKVGFSEKDFNAMMKDVHLVEAALITNKIILSRDDAAKNLFITASRQVKEIRQIIWANPVHDEEEVIIWLEDGAAFEKHRCIGTEERES